MHEGHDFYQPFDQVLDAHILSLRICSISLLKRWYDDLGHEHLKLVAFTTESLLSSTRVGGFNIIMPDVVVVMPVTVVLSNSLVDSICTRNCMASKSSWSSLYHAALWSKSYPKRDLKDYVNSTSSVLSFSTLMHDFCSNNLQSTSFFE